MFFKLYEIFTNISLQKKLKEQGISLPDFEATEEPKCVTDYFKSVNERIRDALDWHISDDIYLGFFSFTKFVMYKDLDPAAWPKGMSPAQHHRLSRHRRDG